MSTVPQEPEEKAQHRNEPSEAEPSAQAEQAVTAGADYAPVNIIPVAPLHWRFLAAAMDLLLIGVFSLFLLSRILLPQEYPAAYTQFLEITAEQQAAQRQAIEAGKTFSLFASSGAIQKNPDIVEMFSYGVNMTALFAFVYFVLCERFMGGATLGKATFRLRVISLTTGRPPTIWESMLRCLVKVAALIEVVFWVSFIAVFFNKMRRTGHDWLSRTLVVSDTALLAQARPVEQEHSTD